MRGIDTNPQEAGTPLLSNSITELICYLRQWNTFQLRSDHYLFSIAG
jgi:hypothetical protein